MVKGRGKTARAAASGSPRTASASAGVAAASAAPAYDPSADPFWRDARPLSEASDLTKGHQVRTRAEFEALKGRHPSPEGILGKLLDLSRHAGVSRTDALDMLSTRLPFAYRAWLASRENPSEDELRAGAEERGQRLAGVADEKDERINAAQAKLYQAVQGIPGDVTLPYCYSAARFISSKFEPEAGVSSVESFEPHYRWDRNLRNAWESTLAVVGWDGRPASAEKVAKRQQTTPKTVKNRIKRAEKDGGYSFEELQRLAAHRNGRRYLWPDERETRGGA